MADDQDQDQQKKLLAIAPPLLAAQPQSVPAIAGPNATFAASMGAPAATSGVAPQPSMIAAPASAPQPPAIASPAEAAPPAVNTIAPPSMGIPQSRIPALPPPTIQSGGAKLWQAAGNVQNPFLRGLARTGAGIARAGDIALESVDPRMASLVPGSELNTNLQNKANEAQFERRQQLENQGETAQAGHERAKTDQERAETEKYKAENPTQKPTKGSLVFDKAGNAIGYQDADRTLMAPDNPKLPPDVKEILGSAKAKPAPGETATQNRLDFQNGVARLAEEGLPTDPAKLESSIQKSKALAPKEKDAMLGYMATNPNPATNLHVNLAESGARTSAANAQKYYTYSDDSGTHLVKGDKVPEGVDAVPVGSEKEAGLLINTARTGNIIQQSLSRVAQDVNDHPELWDNAAARNIMGTSLEQIDRASAGVLVGGTGGSIPLPSGLGDMINTALQNNALDKKTATALKQYIADYRSMKDKVMTMQMEMQGGKIGRGNAMAFKAIADQIPNGATADSSTAKRQIENLQQTQDELMKQFPDKYGDFEKEKPVGSSRANAAAGPQKGNDPFAQFGGSLHRQVQ